MGFFLFRRLLGCVKLRRWLPEIVYAESDSYHWPVPLRLVPLVLIVTRCCCDSTHLVNVL